MAANTTVDKLGEGLKGDARGKPSVTTTAFALTPLTTAPDGTKTTAKDPNEPGT